MHSIQGPQDDMIFSGCRSGVSVVEETRRGGLGPFRPPSHEKELSGRKFKPIRYTYSDIILNDHFV